MYDVIARVARTDEQTEEWMEGIRRWLWDNIATLVMSILPNLQEVEFEAWSYTEEVYPLFWRLLDRAVELQDRGKVSIQASLSKLKTVSLEYWDTEGGMSIEMFNKFLKLKNVASLSAHMVSEDTISEDDPASLSLPTPLSFPTKELSLTNSNISHVAMVRFFRSFPALESLTYTHGGAVIGYADFEAPRMMEAIQHLKPTLKHLAIINDDDFYGSSDIEEHPVGSLADFTCLKSIDMTNSILLGQVETGKDDQWDRINDEGFFERQELTNAIPKSLEELKIRGVTEDIVLQLFSFVSEKEKYAPALKTLDLEWERIKYPDKPSPPGPFVHPGFLKDEAERFWRLYQGKGVEMKMRDEPPKIKYVSYTERREETRTKVEREMGILIPTRVSHVVHYPYTGYEALCREHGCDPETGRRPGEW